jgi:hypothetical protein
MPPSEFPFPSFNASAAHPLFYQEDPEEFVNGRIIYDDNGADATSQSGGSGLRRFIAKYDGVTAAQAAIFDTHIAASRYSPEEGSAYGFNFRKHIPGEVWTSTNGELLANVHYAPGGIKKSHAPVNGVNRCSYEFIFEKRP